jgi:hypothetical protein
MIIWRLGGCHIFRIRGSNGRMRVKAGMRARSNKMNFVGCMLILFVQ